MKLRIFRFIVIGFFLIPSLSFQLGAQVIANFTYTATTGSLCAPVQFNFTNTSTGATSYTINFGNNNIVPNPSYPLMTENYQIAGTYTVILTASNGGSSDEETAVISIYAEPVPNFTMNPSTVCIGQTVLFTDNSTPGSGNINKWEWSFGDATSETRTNTGNTSYIYSAPLSNAPVNLTVTNNFGCYESKIHLINVVSSPTSIFTGNPLAACSTPLNVTFTNSSETKGGATYEWEFGNGNTSTLASPPIQTYTLTGNYPVSLIVKEQGCSDTSTKSVVIQNVVANFTANNTTVCLGQVINFTDQSNPLTVSRTWDFGDGTTSALPNPSHTYASPGTYTVSLNANDCDTEKKDNYITVLPLPTVSFTADDSSNCAVPFLVNFTDNSPGAVSWRWNFGDGGISAIQNPPHTYRLLENYSVSLEITDINGCINTATKNNYIQISSPKAAFTATPREGCIPLTVNFTDTSQSPVSPIISYYWDFGNDTTTTVSPNKSHLYNADSVYTVKLVITSSSGCKDSITKTNYIKAGVKPTPGFKVVNPVICHKTQAEFKDESIGADSAHWVFDVNQGTFDTPFGAAMPFNPVLHFFSDTGTFFVRQVVFHNGCADSLQIPNIIRILPPKPQFLFTLNCNNYYSVNFTDKSEGADSIEWDFGDGTPLLSDVSSPTHGYLSRGIKVVTLTAWNFTTDCFETVSISFTIAEPIALSSIVKDTSCYGVPVLFNNLSQDSNTLFWDFGDSSTTSSVAPTSHIYSQPGLYNSTLIITDVNECRDTLIKVINVQGPIPDFIADTLRGCTPLVVTFTDTSVHDSVLTNWTWDFGDGTPVKSTGVSSIPHTYTLPGSYTVKMDVTDKNGCIKTRHRNNYIEPTFPYPSFIADTLACKNNPMSFDASASLLNVARPAQFNWDFGDGTALGSGVIVSHAYNKDSSYIVKLTVTDKNGCDSTLSHIIHIQNPKAKFIATEISAVCRRTEMQFTDSTNGLSLKSREWKFGDGGGVKDTLNPQHPYTVPGYYTVSLIVTNTAGCADTFKVDNIHVKGPIGSFSFAPKKGCVPLEVIFTANSINATSFFWSFGDTHGDTTTNSVFTYTYTAIGTRTPSLILGIQLEDGSLCPYAADPAGEVVVTPAVTVKIDSVLNVLCNGGQTGKIFSSSSGGTEPYSYSWTSSPVQIFPTATNLTEGSYTITVTDRTNSLGCTARADTLITQHTAIITTAGVNDTVCPGQPAVLTATGTGGAGTYYYVWQPGNITNAGVLNITPTTDAVYTVTAYDKNNCAGTSVTTSVIVLGPIGSFSFAPKKGCVPLEVIFTANSINATSFIWDFGDTYGDTTTNSVVTHTYTAIGTRTPSLILSIKLTDGSLCTFPAAPAGEVVVTPAVTVKIDSVLNVLCKGDATGKIFSSSSGGTMPHSYSWTSSPVQTLPTATNLTEGSYTITVRDSTNSLGCTAATYTLITQPPTAIITTAGVNDTVCPGQPEVLTATATGGAGNYYYVWQPGNTTTNAGVLNITPTTDSIFTVTAYDTNNCAGTSVTTSVIVYKLILDNVQMSSTSPICPGQSSDISVQTPGSTGTLTYAWNPNIGNGPGIYTVIPLAPTTYFVTITNVCGSFVIDSVPVLFYPPPTMAVTSDTNAICVPATIQFNDNSISSNPNDPVSSWNWDFGNGTPTSPLQNPNYVYTQPRTYSVTLTVTTGNGCTNNNSAAPLLINAYPFPHANFSVNSPNLDLPYDVTTVKNQSLDAATYQWDFGDGFTSTAEAPSHLYTSVGTFQIQLIATSQNGCSDTTHVQVTTSADVVFPNAFTPNSTASSGGFYDIHNLDNDIFFPFTSGVVEYKFQIFNRWGELIFESLDVKIGWDGYYKGHICQQDVYVWKAYVKHNNGKEFNKIGDVTLLR